MARFYALLFFLALGMRHFGWSVETLRVTEVRSGLVTMEGMDGVYQIDAAEAWESGDRAEALIRDGRIVEVRFIR